MKHRKYGVQITTTQDGGWSMSQLVQEIPNGEFKRAKPQKTVFFDHSNPASAARLLDGIGKGLKGRLGK
ncbi:MAG: hypothetical protein ABIZ04_21905 [Opitutus sp.]